MDHSTIINEIEQFMSKFGGYYSDWYVGIATNPKDRLFNDHNVNEQNDVWIFRTADTDDIARSIEQYFLTQRETDGGPGGGSNSSKVVYAYKKTPVTQQ